jgi:hypothetical protein
MPKGKSNLVGAWAFLIGIILAVIFAFIPGTGLWLGWVLFIIGIVIGLLNISDKETQPFLMAGVVLVIVTALGVSAFSGLAYIGALLKNILILFVPATIVVALKSVFSMAHD